jgi:hypothetical protein
MRSTFFRTNPVKSRDCGIVDNVDKLPKTENKAGCTAEKNPHPKVEVFPNLDVDNVDNLLTKQVLANIYNVSGPHSYQQISVYTIF